MAFCTSCGAQISDGAKFCTGCGAPQSAPRPAASPESGAVAASPIAAAAQPAAVQPQPQKNNTVKIILIVLVVVVGLIIVAVAGVIGTGLYFAHKVKQGVSVQQGVDGSTVTTPWGNVTTSNDPNKVAEQLGVDVYPGAMPLKEGSSASSFGGISVATAMFESNDSLDQIEQFYKSRFPKSTVSTSEENSRNMIFKTGKGTVTVLLTKEEGKTKIQISKVEGAGKNTEAGE